jgi:hypothetical protein
MMQHTKTEKNAGTRALQQVDTLFNLKKSKPGVDVMITIFCDFCLFYAKIMAFFSKTNVMIKIFA